MPEMPNDPRSLTEILRDAVVDFETILRNEIRLAKLEIKEDARKTFIATGLFLAGGVITLYGAGFALVAIYVAMSHAIWNWLSASVIAAFLMLVGLAVAGGGFRKLRRLLLRTEKTLETIEKEVRHHG